MNGWSGSPSYRVCRDRTPVVRTGMKQESRDQLVSYLHSGRKEPQTSPRMSHLRRLGNHCPKGQRETPFTSAIYLNHCVPAVRGGAVRVSSDHGQTPVTRVASSTPISDRRRSSSGRARGGARDDRLVRGSVGDRARHDLFLAIGRSPPPKSRSPARAKVGNADAGRAVIEEATTVVGICDAKRKANELTERAFKRGGEHEPMKAI